MKTRIISMLLVLCMVVLAFAAFKRWLDGAWAPYFRYRFGGNVAFARVGSALGCAAFFV